MREFPFLFGGAFIEARVCGMCHSRGLYFPSFSEGLSLRPPSSAIFSAQSRRFPFLFGGAFIEAPYRACLRNLHQHFPSFSEGLSLRRTRIHYLRWRWKFPFLFGRAFIEVFLLHSTSWVFLRFLTETFIEASHLLHPISQAYNISLPFL